jgi:hypothetical protein
MNRSTLTFAKHYVEMVLVMFAGMFVIGGALLGAAAALGASGSEIQDDAPAAYLLGMGFSMTVPMVWWMDRRGHSWPANRAMALSMILPTLAALVLLAGGAVTDFHGLMGIQHTLMFPGMLIAMLPFGSEFTHGRRHSPATA